MDVSSSISNLRFTDLDLDQLELGGYATWTGRLGSGSAASATGSLTRGNGDKGPKGRQFWNCPRGIGVQCSLKPIANWQPGSDVRFRQIAGSGLVNAAEVAYEDEHNNCKFHRGYRVLSRGSVQFATLVWFGLDVLVELLVFLRSGSGLICPSLYPRDGFRW